MIASGTLLQKAGCGAPQRHGPRQPLQRVSACSTHRRLIQGPAAGVQQPGIASSGQQRRQLVLVARAAAGGSGGDKASNSSSGGDEASNSSSGGDEASNSSSGGDEASNSSSGGGSSADGGGSGRGGSRRSSSSKGKQKRGRKSHTAEPQPELQAWLEQQQGLPATAADEHARRLAHVFGSQQAALDGLPAIFYFCTRQGLTGLQTAQLLDRIAFKRRDKVTGFVATTQQEWLLLEACIAAHVQRQRLAVKQLPTRTSFASIAGGNANAAGNALGMPPGHVEAWLAAVRQWLSDADIGRLLLSAPQALPRSPESVLAAIAWAIDELGVPEAELGPFLARSVRLLTTPLSTLQGNLAALQQALQQCGLPPELVVQLARKRPSLLTANSGTAQATAAWLQRLFPDAAQLQRLLERCPQLLCASVDLLDRNVACLQRELGWQPDDSQLAAHVQQYPGLFASLDLEGPEVQARLLLLTGVVGVRRTDCLTKWSNYLIQGSLEALAARYMLVQERAPQLLFDKDGGVSLSWVKNAPTLLPNCGAAAKAELLVFQREWQRSEEGRRLLAALRSGSTEGWPLPGTPP